MFSRLFLDHPRAVGETYGEHFAAASGFGGRLLIAGLACLVHAAIPALFPTTASRTVSALHDRLTRRFAPSAADAAHAGE